MYILAIDIGGTQIRAALVTDHGEIMERRAIRTNAHEGYQNVINRLIYLLHELYDPFVKKNGKERLRGIGLAIPGTLNVYEGIVYSSPNLPDWHHVNIRAILQMEFALPVYMNNDANAAALGEYYFGQGKGCDNFIYVTISTGVGAGIIENGRLLLGEYGQAAEVGHMSINPEGPQCKCGNYGCIEAYISGTGIVKRTKDLLQKEMYSTSLLQEKEISTKDVFTAAKKNDELALKIIQDTRKYLGVAIVNLLHLFNPKLIIFGGGVSQVGDYLFEPAMNYAKEHAMYPMAEDVAYKITNLGDNVGLLGATSLVINDLKRKKNLS